MLRSVERGTEGMDLCGLSPVTVRPWASSAGPQLDVSVESGPVSPGLSASTKCTARLEVWNSYITAQFLYGTDARHPFASLGIASNPPETGDLALVTGFPLGSWTPTVQLGLVAAVETLYPPPTPPLGVHKDSGHLLQISVSANHGNSGGPVIDLVTGKVIGVYCKLCLLRLHLAANYAGTSAPLNPRA